MPRCTTSCVLNDITTLVFRDCCTLEMSISNDHGTCKVNRTKQFGLKKNNEIYASRKMVSFPKLLMFSVHNYTIIYNDDT